MKYLCLTQVDFGTKISCLVEPMRSGPAYPDVKGLEVKWAKESAWPTNTPIYFGTCDDDADTEVAGVLEVIDEAKYDELYAEELQARWDVAKSRLEEQVQFRLDAFAKTRGYNSIMSACSYVNSTVESYKIEAEYAVQARDLTWAKLFEIIGEMEAGTREKDQSFQELEKDLPELVWPA
jgi:hypothetical protein